MERLLRLNRNVNELRLQSGTVALEYDKRIRLLLRLNPEEFSFLVRNLHDYEVLAMTAIINRHSDYRSCKIFLIGYNRIMLLYCQLAQN